MTVPVTGGLDAGGLPAPVEARPAATVVVLRPGPEGPEVLLTRRPASMRFGGNLFVFPGGRLEPGEGPRDAAVRETLEETGIRLDPASLVPLTRWVTPFSLPIRFDTRFFGTFVAPGAAVVRPSAEVAESRWLRPTPALEAMRAGDLAMWQPTAVTLQQLEAVATRPDLAVAFAPAATGADGPASEPAFGPAFPNARGFPTTSAGGIEGRAGSTWVVGRRSWLIVDPGDPTGETTVAIVEAARADGAALAGVLLTGLAPERHAGVELFATGLGLPVAGPPGATGLVPYPVLELAGGDVPFGDAGLSVEVVPAGHDAGEAFAGTGPPRWHERAGRLLVGPLRRPVAPRPRGGRSS